MGLLKPIGGGGGGDVSGKADKVSGATANNFAALDATGNLTDSGRKHSDYSSAAHTHAQADVTGLVAALAGKAATSHTHAQSDVTGLVADLAAKASASSLAAHTSATTGIHGATSAGTPDSLVIRDASGGAEFGQVQAQSILLANGVSITTDISAVQTFSGVTFEGRTVRFYDNTDDAPFNLTVTSGALGFSSLNLSGIGSVTASSFSGSGAGLTNVPQSGVTGLTAALAAKAPLASPSFTGTVTTAGALNAGGTVTAPFLHASAFDDTGNLASQGMFENTDGASAAGFSLKNGFWHIFFRTNPSIGWFEIAASDGVTQQRWSGRTYILAQNGVIGWTNDDYEAAEASAVDVNLYRGGVDMLATDDSFSVGGSLTVTGGVTANGFSGSGASLTNIPQSAVTGLTTALAAKAPLASPTFTGTVTAPTVLSAIAQLNTAGPHTLTLSQDTLYCDTTAASMTINLPTAVGNSGKRYQLKKVVGVGTVTLDANGSQTIDGALTYVLRDNNESVEIVSDGTNWRRFTNYAGQIPVGAIVAFHKSFTNTPALPSGYVECNGQVLSDTGSVYNGQTIPNMNGASAATPRFIRGAATSGGEGGSEDHLHSLTDHYSYSADANFDGNVSGVSEPTNTTYANHLPSYISMVWIMRVK